MRVHEIQTLKDFINNSNKEVKLLANNDLDLKKLKNYLYKFKDDQGSTIKLLLDIDKKLVNISIPGKYDFFNIINNKMDGIEFLN